MKIAFFADNFYPELSGVSDSISFTVKELGRLGHQIDIFVPKHPPKNFKIGNVPYEEIDLGPNIKVHRVPSLPIPMPTLQGRLVIPNPFRAIFEKSKFDIVHTHSFWGPGIDARSLARRQKIPLVGTNHTIIESFSPIDSDFVRSFLKKYVIGYFNKCDLATAPSKFLLQKMIKGGLVTSNTSVSNPIQDEFFKSDSTKELLKEKLKLEKFTVLSVGRISPEKNIGTLVRAFIKFAQDKKDVDLVIIGQGNERKTLEEIARNSQVSSQIKFVGPFMGQDRKKLVDYFNASDIFVIPSTSENQSMCVLQAMATGLPTIAADAEGLPELIGEDRGFLFSPYDSDTLEVEMSKFYNDSMLKNEIANKVKIFAETLRAGNIALLWEKVYNDVIIKYKNEHHS